MAHHQPACPQRPSHPPTCVPYHPPFHPPTYPPTHPPTRRQVRARQLWGDGIYTDDSDVVAVLMHMGFYAYSLSAPPPHLVELHVLLKLLPPNEQYPSSHRNSLKSRCWYSRTQGCSFQVRALAVELAAPWRAVVLLEWLSVSIGCQSVSQAG